MITGTHLIYYSPDPDTTRAFFRDVLELPFVDTGANWLIFALPPPEIGVHPVVPDGPDAGRQEMFLMCDDIENTVAELRAKGVEFSSEISEEPWGRLISLRVPGGGGDLGLYEPKHPLAPQP